MHRETDDAQTSMLAKLHEEVRKVYLACGFKGGTDDTLQMLSDMEARLEDLLSALEQMDPHYVQTAEKEKARERREQKRLEHQMEEERKYEEKLKQQMRRAQQPVHVKTGKPVMFRSQPIRKKQQKKEDTGDKEAERIERRYFTSGGV